jgi:hypothetical protein
MSIDGAVVTDGVVGLRRRDCAGRSVRAIVCRPGKGVRLALSVQEEASRDHYIVRGHRIPQSGLVGEHATNISGEKSYRAETIRRDTPSYDELLLRYSERHPDSPILGYAGCGNVTMNPRFMAYIEGRLVYTKVDRKDPLSSFSVPNPSLVVRADGRPEFAKVRFELSPKAQAARVSAMPKFFSASDKDFNILVDGKKKPAKGIRYILQGPLLVEAGRAKQQKEIVDMAADGWFYDLRHVILFPWLQLKETSASVGLENMWKGGALVPAEVRRALEGEVIRLDVSPYRRALTAEAAQPWRPALEGVLAKASYAACHNEPQRPGEYRFVGTTLEIVYRPGVYNHSLLGLTKDGELIWLGLAGLGNRLGVTMADAAKLAKLNGFEYAILVDNGGDVMLSVRDQFVLSSTYGRGHIRSLLLFVSPGKCLLVSPDKYLPTQDFRERLTARLAGRRSVHGA